MGLMFVLRSTYEREREARLKAEAAERTAVASAFELARLLVAMKREGFVAAAPTPDRKPAPSTPLEIISAISDSTAAGSEEERDARTYAVRALAGLDAGSAGYADTVDRIVSRVRYGGTVPDGMPL